MSDFKKTIDELSKKKKVNPDVVLSPLNAFYRLWPDLALKIIKFLQSKRQTEIKTYLSTVENYTSQGTEKNK